MRITALPIDYSPEINGMVRGFKRYPDEQDIQAIQCNPTISHATIPIPTVSPIQPLSCISLLLGHKYPLPFHITQTFGKTCLFS
ncbi:hypothetical protein R4Z09_13905 [Niallia oryzisoli]|uniref:Uncharacterized protein n=1 Tax=Niallia oryzisoli TaxID=1737571 RepID=A0ABZ2CKR5_9BACI